MIDHIECSFRHKLKHIDKIETDNDGPSIHTEFGQAIHNAMELYIVLPKDKRVPINPIPAQEEFARRCEAMRLSGKEVSAKDEKDFSETIPGMLASVPAWLDKTFPFWEGVEAEKALYEKIEAQRAPQEVFFKGFIDAIIKVPKTRKKKKATTKPLKKGSVRLSVITESEEAFDSVVIPGEYVYYILDWKTCNYGWDPKKKRDFNKQLQLMLYKSFLCDIMDLELDQVRCAFVLMKRKTTKKNPTAHCELVTVSVGSGSKEKSLVVLNKTINQIKKGFVLKDKRNCKYCPYFNTPHCR